MIDRDRLTAEIEALENYLIREAKEDDKLADKHSALVVANYHRGRSLGLRDAGDRVNRLRMNILGGRFDDRV